MIKTVINKIIEQLKESGINEVYSFFDNISVAQKGNGIYNIVGIECFESSVPIYSMYYYFIPFRAEASISVTASTGCNASELYDYFDSKILPVIKNISGMSCIIRNITLKKDDNINRMVLKLRFSVAGTSQIERGVL